jgi:hypothetical protein
MPMFEKSVIMAIPIASPPVRAIVPPAIARSKAIRIIICRIRIVEEDAVAETDTEAAPGVCTLGRWKDQQKTGKSRNYDQILDFLHFRSASPFSYVVYPAIATILFNSDSGMEFLHVISFPRAQRAG